MKRIAGEVLYSHHNQYPPMLGLPEARQAVATHSERYAGLRVDWASETLITVGATEALAAAFLGLLNPGDEVRPLSTVQCSSFSFHLSFRGF